MALVEAAQLHQVEKIGDAAADLLVGGPRAARTDPEAIGDVLRHREMAEQRVVLEDEADTTVAHGKPGGVLLAEQDAPRRRCLQTRDQAQEGRLARARRAQQRQQLARLDGEIDMLDRDRTVEGLGETLGADRDSGRPVSADGRGRGRRRIAIRGRTWRPG
jgi:hypothetical protein